MKRLLMLAVVGAVLMPPFHARAHRQHETPRCPIKVTPRSGPKRVAKIVRCAARVTPGVSPDKAVAVASCESGLNPYARSPGNHLGLMQHHEDYWAERARRYGFAGHHWTDPVAQAFVTARMVRDGGWSPWSCA